MKRCHTLMRRGACLVTLSVLTISLMASSPVAASTKNAAPARLQRVRAEAGNASATIIFTTPSSNGGSRVLEYNVVTHPQTQVHHCARTRCRISGLSNGVTYFFTVAGVNKVGSARYSPPSNKVTPRPFTTHVVFNANGGMGTMPNEVENYAVATALTSNGFTNTGYTLKGWNTAVDGSGTAYLDGATYPFTASTTLYAQWTINTTTVAFNANGGTGTMPNEVENYAVATALTSNGFTNSVYTFNGWNTAADGSGTAYLNGAFYSFTASTTLYAQWTTTLTPAQSPGMTSSNWAGYVLSEGSGGYQAVSAQWVVPTLNCSSLPNSSTADWVGVNGAFGNTGLFQDGTLSRCTNGVQVAAAWWTDEAQNFLMQPLFAVSPGDLIDAQVYQQASGAWVYYVKDLTTGQVSSSPESYVGTGMTAEWIAEDPGSPATGGLEPLQPSAL